MKGNLADHIAASGLRDGGTLSLHHHLRDGDSVMEQVLRACQTLGLTQLHLAASSLFPCHASLVPFLSDGTVSHITTAYMNGPLADFVTRGGMENPVRFTTHGGRARILAQERPDLAVIATPAVDGAGNLGGADGPWACGPLGYGMVDAMHARHVLAVTPHRMGRLSRICIPAEQVHAVAQMDSIGDATRIESGTTARAPSDTGKAIAAQVIEVIRHSGLLGDGFTFQAGAGAISLAVARQLGPVMAQMGVAGEFTAGGITAAHVQMARAGLFRRIKNVQSFDLAAVRSYARDAMHDGISADAYANPDRPDCIAHKLDVMILGAAEVDTRFNVNVTTTGAGRIIGGSGGHADTAEGAKLAIVTVPTQTRGQPRIVEHVRCITTPGSSIDAVVSERGICVNPARGDLADRLRRAGLPLCEIASLATAAMPSDPTGPVVARIETRRGEIQDVVRQGVGNPP